MGALEDLAIFKGEGNGLYQSGEYAGAIAAYSKAVKLLPSQDDDDDNDAGDVGAASEVGCHEPGYPAAMCTREAAKRKQPRT